MRYLILVFSVLTAACADTRFSAPTAPSSTVSSAGSTEATGGSELPFSGTLQATETVAGVLHQLSGTGEATHLGRFTLLSEFTVIPPPVSTASGTATWIAASGDELFTTVAGQAVITFPTAALVETHTVTGGTGRFAEASGTLVVERSLNIQTLASSGSITGTISLGH
jgi:hypothetical protein